MAAPASLSSEAILAVLEDIPATEDVKVKDVAEAARKLHPVAGATPTATASAQIYTLAKKGVIRKPLGVARRLEGSNPSSSASLKDRLFERLGVTGSPLRASRR